MLLVRLLIPIVLLFNIVRSEDYEDEESSDICEEKETINLADMQDLLKFSGKATCSQYEKIFRFNPDPSETRGRVFNVLEMTGRAYLHFKITEFTTHPNGTIDREVLRSDGLNFGAETRFAPTTGILITFTRKGGISSVDFTFSASLAETALHHTCPYPFIDLQPNAPIVLDDAIITYMCDVLVTAPEGYEIRIDHIKDTSALHNTLLTFREDSVELLTFNDFPVQETMIGSGRATIDIRIATGHSHQLEIQISAVKLNCTCGPSDIVFNSSSQSLFYQSPDYPKKHCRMVSCNTTFLLPVNLRKNYKLQLDPFERLEHGFIEIGDGPNGISTRNDRLTRSFAFESPVVKLKYIPSGGRLGDAFSLEMRLVERVEGCECPHQTNLATNFLVKIPAHCAIFDCLYLLPKIHDNTVQLYIESDETNDYIADRSYTALHDDLQFVAQRSYTKYSFASSIERLLIHFHRLRSTARPTIFNLTYTTSGVHISHAERCGCFNKTVLLESNQAMDFSSPDWPDHYCDNLVCVTTYIAPAHHHLEVKLDVISLEPDRDRVVFYEGTNITTSKIQLVTGELLIPDPISSSSTVLTTVFVSNGAVSFDGYNGTITAVMDKSWADHLKHHLSAWWWLLSILLLVCIAGVILVLKRQGGLRRAGSIHLMDF